MNQKVIRCDDGPLATIEPVVYWWSTKLSGTYLKDEL